MKVLASLKKFTQTTGEQEKKTRWIRCWHERSISVSQRERERERERLEWSDHAEQDSRTERQGAERLSAGAKEHGLGGSGGRMRRSAAAVSRRRTKKRAAKGKTRTVATDQDHTEVYVQGSTTVFFWNARGLENELDGVIDYMVEKEAAVGAFMETRLFKKDVSRVGWKWIGGAEYLPSLGDEHPRLGLGALIDTERCPGAIAVAGGNYSLWINIPGQDRDMYLCITHVPVYPDPERAVAWQELAAGYTRFRSLGLVAFVGDFNSRCGMNGDTVLGTCARAPGL